MNNNTTYKDSPLGKIPSDWEVKTLGEVCLLKGEYGINASAVEYSDELPTYIRITDIDDDGKYTAIKKASVDDENSQNFLLKKGDIVFARTGATVGKTYLYNENDGDLVFAGFLIRYRPNDCFLLPQHLNYFTSTKPYWDWVKKVSMRSGQPGINAEEYSSLKLPLPSVLEQTRIAEVLSAWDKAISNVQATIEQVELRNKWLMQELLSGKRRLKGFGGEWKEVKMKDVFDRIYNINDGDDKHSVMTISAKRGLISQEDKFDRVIAGDSLKKYTLLSKNDFAYNKGNSKTYQMGCIYQLEDIESALVPFVYICFSPTEKVYSAFYKHWFLAHGLDRQLNRIITSGARGDGLLNVNTDEFFKLKIPYPTLEEQTGIAQVLQAASNEVRVLRNKLDKLKEQKKGLMQVLLTGKKRLKI